MLVGEGDAGVDEASRRQVGARLLGGGLEGEVGEEGRGGVVGEVDEEGFCCGALDGADDEFAYSWCVLPMLLISISCRSSRRGGWYSVAYPST